MGQQLNVSGQAVSKWENGDSLPDTTLLASVARALECTTDYLLGADQIGGVNRYLPSLESEMRLLEPSQKIDLAFKLFHLIDDMSYTHTGDVLNNHDEAGMPFVHAGPNGVTIWWRGKLICNASIEALRETASGWNDSSLPFDLFSEAWNGLCSALLTQDHLFGSDIAISEDALKQEWKLDFGFEQAVNEWMNAGLLEKGKGGYRIGIKAEVLFRLLGVLLRTVGKPGSISQAYIHRPSY